MVISPASVAVVTGASSGIGAATVRRLAGHGRTVVCCDVDDDAGEAVAASSGATYTHLDVGDAAAWDDLATRLDRGDRPLTGAVLNAGILTSEEPRAFLEVTVDRYRRVRAVNLDGIVRNARGSWL